MLASALLGMEPPELPVAQLVRLTGLFGISENRARVALSRMVAAGEATSDGSGRYRLAGHLAARQSRQSASRSGSDRALRRPVVAGRGDDGRQYGRGPRRPPACPRLRPAGRAARGGLDAARQRRRAAARLPRRRRRAHDGAARRPATHWPDGCGTCRRGRTGRAPLLGGLGALAPDGPEALAPGFELSAAVLRHLQADPLLPAELLPDDWPGVGLRATYDEWDARYRATLREWSRTR